MVNENLYLFFSVLFLLSVELHGQHYLVTWSQRPVLLNIGSVFFFREDRYKQKLPIFCTDLSV